MHVRPVRETRPVHYPPPQQQDMYAAPPTLASVLANRNKPKETNMEICIPNRYVPVYLHWAVGLQDHFRDLHITPETTELQPFVVFDSHRKFAWKISAQLKRRKYVHEPFAVNVSWWDKLLVDLDNRFGSQVFVNSVPTRTDSFKYSATLIPTELQFEPNGALIPDGAQFNVHVNVSYLGTVEDYKRKQASK